MAHHLEYSASFPVAPGPAFEHTLRAPLDDILGTRWLVIPGITRVEGSGPWGSGGVGQQRALHFGDGGGVRETLTRLDPPHAFGYSLDAIRGPMRALVGGVDGLWSFAPVGTGTRITWSWDITPAHPATGLALPAFGVAWRGAARRAFARLERHLLAL